MSISRIRTVMSVRLGPGGYGSIIDFSSNLSGTYYGFKTYGSIEKVTTAPVSFNS